MGTDGADETTMMDERLIDAVYDDDLAPEAREAVQSWLREQDSAVIGEAALLRRTREELRDGLAGVEPRAALRARVMLAARAALRERDDARVPRLSRLRAVGVAAAATIIVAVSLLALLDPSHGGFPRSVGPPEMVAERPLAMEPAPAAEDDGETSTSAMIEGPVDPDSVALAHWGPPASDIEVVQFSDDEANRLNDAIQARLAGDAAHVNAVAATLHPNNFRLVVVDDADRSAAAARSLYIGAPKATNQLAQSHVRQIGAGDVWVDVLADRATANLRRARELAETGDEPALASYFAWLAYTTGPTPQQRLDALKILLETEHTQGAPQRNILDVIILARREEDRMAAAEGFSTDGDDRVTLPGDSAPQSPAE
jgi:hypothetical protein